jgi:hypothetical protein
MQSGGPSAAGSARDPWVHPVGATFTGDGSRLSHDVTSGAWRNPFRTPWDAGCHPILGNGSDSGDGGGHRPLPGTEEGCRPLVLLEQGLDVSPSSE